MAATAHIARLRDDGERLAASAAAAGLDAPVPTCPEWRVRDLVQHTGGVHRWATSYLLTGRERETTDAEDAQFFERVEDGELLPWFRAGHSALVSALSSSSPDLACWTFLASTSPRNFWARRQAHETAIHRADADAAAGHGSSFPADFADDGIDELLNGFLVRPRGRLVSDPSVSLAIRTTDTGSAWTMRIEPDRRVVSAGADDATCRVSGTASDLYLLLWNRQALDDRVEVGGDRAVLDLWRERATIRWS